MSRTIRLFDENSHQYTFTATVLSCTAGDDPTTASVVLDQTAFFPEGGGQAADPGYLGGFEVRDVQEREGIIYHTVSRDPGCLPFAPGDTVKGQIDEAVRFARMQNHSAEHIISGLVHRKYGYTNVGFHLGDEDVTFDFDGVLDRAQLDELEDEANRIICACVPIRAYYPDPETLANMAYRSKLDLTEHVRIVEIGENGCYDRCACCAPHVNHTGEIGLVKLLDFIHYKGGVRIHMLAGSRALADYRRRYAAVSSIAAALSVKQEDVCAGFARMQDEIEEKKSRIAALRGQVEELTFAAIEPTPGSLCLFHETMDPLEMRRLLNRAVTKCGRLCGVFVGSDSTGYRYVIGRGSPDLNLKDHVRTINQALSARGGGSPEMLQGSSTASRAEIEAFFREF